MVEKKLKHQLGTGGASVLLSPVDELTNLKMLEPY